MESLRHLIIVGAVLLLAGCATNFRQGLDKLEHHHYPEALHFFTLDADKGYRVPAILAADLYILDYQIPRNLEQSKHYLEVALKAEYGPYDQAWDYYVPLIKAHQILVDNEIADKRQAFQILNYDKYKDYHWALRTRALCHLTGFHKEQNADRAQELFEKALDNEIFEGSSLSYAFWLTIHPDESFRDPTKALRIVKEVEDDEDFNTLPIYLDTLAAAYSASGRHDEAVKTQTLAIARIKEIGIKHPYVKSYLPTFESRLSAYQTKSHWQLSHGDIKRCGIDYRRCAKQEKP